MYMKGRLVTLGNPLFAMLATLCLASASHAATPLALEEKTVPAQTFFYQDYQLKGGDLHSQGAEIAQKTAWTIATKTDTVLKGALTYVFQNIDRQESSVVTAQIGWPIEKPTAPVGNYKVLESAPFHCLVYTHEGSNKALPEVWRQLHKQAIAEGYRPIGEGRTVIRMSGKDGYVVAELQLGIE